MFAEHGPDYLRFVASVKHAQLLREAEQWRLERRVRHRRPRALDRLAVRVGGALCSVGLRLQKRQAL